MKPRTRQRAFTLIEMAIVLIIIGLLVGLVAPIVTDMVKREKTASARSYVEQVKNEIIGFAIINKRLPTSSELGTKVDPFGSNLIYLPSADMTSQDFCATAPSSASLYTVQEQLPSGGPNSYTSIAFIIASPGRNLATQFTTAGQTVTTYDPRAWTPVAGQDDFDDIIEYVSFNYLKNKVCTNSSGGASPPGSATSFASDPGAYGSDSIVSTSTASGGSFTNFDATTQTLTFDTDGSSTNQAGCVFYKGNIPGNCTDGLCRIQNGIRAYFKFKVQPASNGGFTFALVGVNASDGGTSINCPESTGAGTTDTLTTCKDTTRLCGGVCGYLGYANTYGSHLGLAAPKMAIEFDLYSNLNGDYNDDVFDPPTTDNNNHITLDFWNTRASLVDDVYHGYTPVGVNGLQNPTAVGTFYEPGSNAWMEDGVPHTARIEMHRNPSIANGGNSTWELYAWYDCNNCTDLSVDFDPSNPGSTYAAVVSNNATLAVGTPSPLYDSLNYFRFGWTSGICGTQTINITDFGLSFR